MNESDEEYCVLAQFSWQTMQNCHSLEHTCVVNICEFTVKTLKTGDIDCSAAVLQGGARLLQSPAAVTWSLHNLTCR